MKGTKTYWGPDIDFVVPVSYLDKTINFDYLILPVLGSFSTKGKIKFYMDAGIYLGFLLSQKDICSARDSLPRRVVDNYDKIKKLDFGISSGLGLRIPLGKNLLLDFGFCQNTGLISINKTYLSNNDVLRTSSAGLPFGLKYML